MKATEMKLFFEGANGSVTGSCSRLVYSCDGKTAQILVDCGLIQDSVTDAVSVPEWSFWPAKISCVLLTHAHIDHCGAIPLLYKRGFKGKVYATDATIDLARVMLNDIASSSRLFEKADVDMIRWQSVDDIERGYAHAKYFPILTDIRACFIRSSHILGASAIYVQWFKYVLDEDEKAGLDKGNHGGYKTIFFSGDVGRSFDGLNPGSTFLKPNFFPFTNDEDGKEIYVLESTYGNRTHASDTGYDARLSFLEQILKTALSDKGYVVIPAFALDRTQTILGDLFDVLKSKVLLEKDEIFAAELKKIENDKNMKQKEKEKRIVSAKDASLKRNRISIHSISPLGNAVNKIYADNLGADSKVMDSKGKIRFRYLNATPFIPEEFIDEQNQNTDKTISDYDVKCRISCLTGGNFSGDKYANNFVFTNEEMFVQKKMGVVTKKVPKDTSAFIAPRSIIVGASGMCDKGFIQSVVGKTLTDQNATIILTGFTPAGTAGSVLKALASHRKNPSFSKTDMFNKTVPSTNVRLYEVKAKIVDMSDFYSAHADSNELLTYVFSNPNKPRFNPVQVLLNHGSESAGLALAKEIDAFNEKLANSDGNAPKTIVTSPDCNAFDISGDELVCLNNGTEKQKNEKLLAEEAASSGIEINPENLSPSASLVAIAYDCIRRQEYENIVDNVSGFVDSISTVQNDF